MMEEKTLISITVNNANQIKTDIDLTSILDEEEPLRIVHSVLDQYRDIVLSCLSEIRTIDSAEDAEDIYDT